MSEDLLAPTTTSQIPNQYAWNQHLWHLSNSVLSWAYRCRIPKCLLQTVHLFFAWLAMACPLSEFTFWLECLASEGFFSGFFFPLPSVQKRHPSFSSPFDLVCLNLGRMEGVKIRRRQSHFHVVSKALRPVARPRAAEAFHEFDKSNYGSCLSLATRSHPSGCPSYKFMQCHIGPPEALMLKLPYPAQLSRFLRILVLICQAWRLPNCLCMSLGMPSVRISSIQFNFCMLDLAGADESLLSAARGTGKHMTRRPRHSR